MGLQHWYIIWLLAVCVVVDDINSHVPGWYDDSGDDDTAD